MTVEVIENTVKYAEQKEQATHRALICNNRGIYYLTILYSIRKRANDILKAIGRV